MNLQESGEMYLETILILSKENNNIRAIDVSNYMGFSKPSVSRAMGLLKDEKYITIEDNFIKLTKKGLKVAESIYERHLVISELLKSLGVNEKTAVEDACKIEHDISKESFEMIKNYIEANEKRL